MPAHTIKEGECLSSIAEEYGFDCMRIWNLPENTDLRVKRKNPNILHPGDAVFIPEKELRNESRAVQQRHSFRRKGVPVTLRIRLLSAGKPVDNEAYRLEVDGRIVKGKTDDEGILEQVIASRVEAAKLVLENQSLELHLEVGHLDPVTEVSGVQARLNNLGYHCGDVDGVLALRTRSALQAFQETHRLEVTGAPDDSTRDKLKELHGC